MSLQLEAPGLPLTRHARDIIRVNIEKLKARFGKLTACRIVIRPPGTHHRPGAQFSVNIHLTLPGGREVNVGRASRAPDPRYDDVAFALHDTFRKAVRQLQRQVARLRAPVPPRRRPLRRESRP